MTNMPLPEDTMVRPFTYSSAQVRRIAAGLSAYILFILYPAYGLLRGWWLGDFSSFSIAGVSLAVATASAFGLFAHRTMLKYLQINT